MVNIISDRSSNFVVKSSRCSDPLFCFGRRLNNFIRTSLFQNERKTELIDVPSSSNDNMAPQKHRNVVSSLNRDPSNEEESENDEESI